MSTTANRIGDSTGMRRRAARLWENVFTPYRARVLYPIAIAAAAIFIPLGIHDYLQGRIALSLILFITVATLAADAVAVRLGRRPPVPFAALLVPGAGAVGMSLATQGIYGALWSFPFAFLAFFVLSRPAANAVGAALVLAGSALTAISVDLPTAVRYGLSLALCLVILNVILNVLQAMHARLLAQTLTDPLTGAYNRRHMDTVLEEMRERHRRSSAPVSALLIDIDHFKDINDTLGHRTGDVVLKAIVRAIQQRRRKLDLLFRHGGEEFLLLLPDTRVSEAQKLAESLRAFIEAARAAPDRRVTVSIGVGELQAKESVRDWMGRVDAALYRAKDSGRNTVVADRPPQLRKHLLAA
jgi:diguanylate cyclase (GGDEF)-like protein